MGERGLDSGGKLVGTRAFVLCERRETLETIRLHTHSVIVETEIRVM
jgi:hypothetical protein